MCMKFLDVVSKLMSRYADAIVLEIWVASVVYCPLERLYPALPPGTPPLVPFVREALNHVSDNL
jgi:hypothetical protein